MLKPRNETELASWRGGSGLYNGQWSSFRGRWIKSFPVCAVCLLTKNKPVQTVFCDHLRAHKGDLTLFGSRLTWADMANCTDPNNVLSPMCRDCHGAKSGAEKLGFDCKANGHPLPGREASLQALWDLGYDQFEMPVRAGDYVAFLMGRYRELTGSDGI